MSTESITGRDSLVEQIRKTEKRLNELRALRDEQIIEAHQQRVSKYRLAKDWGVSENTITRIVTGIKPGKTA